MVRHTEADDESTTTTRRTRRDLEALADLRRNRDDVAPDRVDRLVEHGWSIDDGRLTADGERLSMAVDALRNDDVEDDDLSYALRIMGMGTFVDESVRAKSAQDFVGYVRGLLVVANTVDEARHDAGTQDVEYDHDGLFEPHFAPDGFDARKGTVEVRFEDEATARSWVGYVSRYEPTYKHDERFKGNRNPRRVVVDVLS